jgi:hypothetical protein
MVSLKMRGAFEANRLCVCQVSKRHKALLSNTVRRRIAFLLEGINRNRLLKSDMNKRIAA